MIIMFALAQRFLFLLFVVSARYKIKQSGFTLTKKQKKEFVDPESDVRNKQTWFSAWSFQCLTFAPLPI